MAFILDPNNAIDWGHPLNYKRYGLWTLLSGKVTGKNVVDLCYGLNSDPAASTLTRSLSHTGKFYSIRHGTNAIPVTAKTIFALNTPVTLSCWFRSVWNTNANWYILALNSGSSGAYEMFLQVNLNGSSPILTYRVMSGPDVVETYTHNKSLSDFKYHHYLATYDGSKASIFLDGVLVSGPTTRTAQNINLSHICLNGISTSQFGANQLDCMFHSVWTRCLSASEVWQEYCYGMQDYCTPNSPLKWVKTDDESWLYTASTTIPIPIFRHHYVNQRMQ